jgi:hypothetical protein
MSKIYEENMEVFHYFDLTFRHQQTFLPKLKDEVKDFYIEVVAPVCATGLPVSNLTREFKNLENYSPKKKWMN